MNVRAIDTLNQHTVARRSHRRSLLALGSAGLVAVAGQFTAEGKKKGAKNKNKARRAPRICPAPPDNPCPAEAEQCATITALFCEGSTTCQQQVDCCSFLQTCDANGYFACLAAV
jgi:hypothetical protein